MFLTVAATGATKERRSPDRRFEFSAKGAAFRTSLGQRPRLDSKGKTRQRGKRDSMLFALFSLVAPLKSEPDSRLQRSLILRLSNPWGDAPG
jgi:hypothetical protein